TASRLRRAAPEAEDLGIHLALENHCDSFSQEVLWVIEQADHSHVGACIDTMNPWHMTEDPMAAIENLAPVAFTNHFRDDRIDFTRDGFKVSGTAVGEGDIDMVKAYEILRTRSRSNRINIETEMGFSLKDKDEALRQELDTVKRSIRFCRETLKIGGAST
ncbi:MAG: sugar phosphate isomerase/epimerase, partial [Desulfobacterales bacterium]|nr:sugar phosphate isomerase/epimerase [Desulfobacterales bacterium]